VEPGTILIKVNYSALEKLKKMPLNMPKYSDVSKAIFQSGIWVFRYTIGGSQTLNGNTQRNALKNVSVVGKAKCYLSVEDWYL
jgi:hypothetical protein